MLFKILFCKESKATCWHWPKLGLSLKEIANRWEEKHEGEVYGEETVRAAYSRDRSGNASDFLNV